MKRSPHITSAETLQQNVTIVKVYGGGSGCSGCLAAILILVAVLVGLVIFSDPR